jgi:hypothetical protein
MSAVQPHIAEIDAAIVRGEWWRRVFRELSEVAMARAEALSVAEPKGLAWVAVEFCRFARAVRLAVVATMRLGNILRGLEALRHMGAQAIADARASAKAMAEAAATARENLRARREARLAEIRERVGAPEAGETLSHAEGDHDKIDPNKPARRERDPLVEALDRRLTVDPAGVDFDDLQLRETVLRICADLNISPDWSRWDAGDWSGIAPASPSVALVQTAPAPTSAGPKFDPPPLIGGLPGLTSATKSPGFQPRLE